MPSSVQWRADLRLEVYFPSLKQGSVGLLRLSGGEIDSAELNFRGKTVPFFHLDADAWYALLVTEMDMPARGSYPLTVLARRGTETIAINRYLQVESAAYIRQDFEMAYDRARLVDAELERAEFDALDVITADGHDEPLWDASGFDLPLDAELTSPFGAFRLLNGAMETRHTGWDQNAAEGTAIRAMAAGEVAFAGALEIRGYSVVIDHGYDVFSLYAHFSELLVETGDRVSAGQIIGLSGNTGRSSGPHLHWEILYQGEWVDGAAFIDMWLPAP